MKLYMKVTNDELELPVAVADSAGELAEMTGVSKNAIFSNITHQKDGSITNGCYKLIEIEEEPEQ